MNKYFFIFIFLSSSLGAQQTVGLFQNDSLSVNGYTLFSSNEITYLIDNCGFIVNTWTSDYNPGSSVYLLENGNLLRTARIGGNFGGGGAGGRIELFNWEGDLVWWHEYAGPTFHQHHDIEPLPNGNFLILAWESKTAEEAIQAGRTANQPVWPERIVEVAMIGVSDIFVEWEWHLWDHLIQDVDPSKDNFGVIEEHPELVNINFTNGGGFNNPDWIHLNAVSYNPELDQIALSSRHHDEIWIIDHSTTTEEAAGHTGGNSGKGGDILYRWGNPQAYNRGTDADKKLHGQHDVRWVPAGHPNEGNLMVFNNNKFNNMSAIDMWLPPMDSNGNYLLEEGEAYGPPDLTWTYASPGFYAERISGAHSLPNGNILICEGRDGRFFEVIPSNNNQIVWEYISPVNNNGPVQQGQNANQNDTFRATRYPSDYPAFEGKDLTPGLPIELNPFDSQCMIYEDPIALTNFATLEGVHIINNPFNEAIFIKNETNDELIVELFDLSGSQRKMQKVYSGLIEVPTSELQKGFYIIKITSLETNRFFVQKVVKQ